MMPKARAVLKQGWFFCVPFAVLLVLMFRYNLNPETAALAAAATIFVFGLFRGYAGNRIGPSAIWHALVTTGMTSVQILVICGVAGMIIGIINVTGLAFSIGLVLTQIGGTSLFLLLLVTGFICILLGMSMPTTSLYILLSTLVVPSLIDLGAMPIAAHFFVLYFGIMSFVTPPVAFAAFAAANIADASPMRTGWTAMRFGWVAYIVPVRVHLLPVAADAGRSPAHRRQLGDGRHGSHLCLGRHDGLFPLRADAGEAGDCGAGGCLPAGAQRRAAVRGRLECRDPCDCRAPDGRGSATASGGGDPNHRQGGA